MTQKKLKTRKTTDTTEFVQEIAPGMTVKIWRSENGLPVEEFRKVWVGSEFLTVVKVIEEGRSLELDVLAYKERLTDAQIIEQINIYENKYKEKDIGQTGPVHSKELPGNT